MTTITHFQVESCRPGRMVEVLYQGEVFHDAMRVLAQWVGNLENGDEVVLRVTAC